jgi:hypothetical protein
MKLKDVLELYEDLQLVKFKYSNYKNDPNPKVKVLDYEYPGIKGQKTYGTRKDLLGFNINYFKNPKYAKRAIDEIDGFARMLSADKKEKYSRLKYFYPEVTKFVRRYNREHISNLKRKGFIFYKKADYDTLIRKDVDSM